MKLFITICVLFVIASTDWVPPTKEETLKFREECFKSEHVPEEIIEKLKKHEYGEDLGHEAKCHVRCMGLKVGNWDDEKGYNLDRTLEAVHSFGLELSSENLKKCLSSHTANDDKCEWAANDMKCLWTNKYISRKEK